MSLRNHVVWQDGLFIKPHHFQQQQRYFEHLVRTKTENIQYYLEGFSTLELNQEALLHGKIGLDKVAGMMSDGTMFNMPNEEPIPQPIDVSYENLNNEIVYLVLPLRVNGVPEITGGPIAPDNIRMKAFNQEVRDNASEETEAYFIDVAQPCFSIRLEREDLSSYVKLPIARIAEKRSDGSLVLDPSFIPTHIDINVATPLSRALDDFTGLLQTRAKEIAARLGTPDQGGVPEVADFLMLQTVNRLSPLFRHLSTIHGVHPELLYSVFGQAAGELATFTHGGRLPDSWPVYNHTEPHLCFKPLIDALRSSLSAMLEPNAIALPLKEYKYGIMTSQLHDLSLKESCIFVIAVKASIPLEKLAREFPAQVKVSSIEKIRDLINLHLPGVIIQPLPSAPRQLPYHAGYTYFQLDSNSAGWEDIVHASGFAFHIAGSFPNLEIQFWAIRT